MRLLSLTLLFLFCITITYAEKKDFENAVKQAIERQLNVYPKSTLKDLYKNFFQDKYGPGHIISDTTSAGNYLRKELASYNNIEGEITEPTGWEGNFYRVNLSVLKQNIIPYPIFFKAFVESVNGIQPIPVEVWKKEWDQIEHIICSMNLSLPNYEAEKKEIDERFEKGEYVGHHSKIFNEAYSPHYRIISKERFEQDLLPILQQ